MHIILEVARISENACFFFFFLFHLKFLFPSSSKASTLLQLTGVKMNILCIRRSINLCALLQKKMLFDFSRAVCCVFSMWWYPWPVFWPDEAVWSRGFSCQHTLPLPRGLCRQRILQYWGKNCRRLQPFTLQPFTVCCAACIFHFVFRFLCADLV